MLDPHSLSDYSSHILKHSAQAELAPTSADSDLAQRLGLYQVFLKLYEHHRGLLNEILDLENNSGRSRAAMQFVQGMVRGPQVTLVSNLVQGKTLALFQPQRIWLIGRDRGAAISVPDTRLSRRHAALQYIEAEGFHIIDLGSTNGTYVNGEPIRGSVLLQDGDQVRLGSLSFTFFLCDASQAMDAIPSDVLQKINTCRLGETAIARDTEATRDTVVRLVESGF
jgi:pSer/pThr/pTyr-binding forkhead associated (FHA) protein